VAASHPISSKPLRDTFAFIAFKNKTRSAPWLITQCSLSFISICNYLCTVPFVILFFFSLAKPLSKSLVIKIGVYIIYLILLVLGLMHHEMWRDEYDWFIQTRDTADFFKLNETMSPGHGMIWRTCLWLITRVTHAPVALQVFHGFIAAAFAFVILFKSPFKVWQSAALLFGYFFVFEYAVISRCYAFGVLFVMLFALNYSKNRTLTLTGAFLLFLFSNTSVYALMITLALTLYLFFKEWNERPLNLRSAFFSTWKRYGLILLGIAVSAWQIMPHPDNSFPLHKVTWPFDDYRFFAGITQLFSAFVPICRFKDPHFWNTNFMMNDLGLVHWAWVLVVFIVVSIPFIKNRSVLLLWVFGVLLIVFFQYYTGFRFARYYGHLFVLWVVCYWLLIGNQTKDPKTSFIQKLIVFLVLFTQVIGGVSMYASDYKLKFSRGKDTAKYIKSAGLQNAHFIATTDFSMSPISGELDRPLFYLEQMALGTYTRWDKNRQNSFDSADIVKAIELAPTDKPIVFICSYPVTQLAYFSEAASPKPADIFFFGPYKFQLLRYFEPGIEKYEGYWIFKVTKP